MERVGVASLFLRCLIVGVLFFLLAFPFLCFLHLFPLTNLPSYFLSAAAVVVGWVLFLMVDWQRLYVPKLALWILVFFVVLLISALLGESPSADVRGLVIFGVVIFLASMLAAWIRDHLSDYYEMVAILVLLGGLVQAVAAIVLHYGLLDESLKSWMALPSHRMTGLLSQFNLLAMYIFCAFLSAGYLYIKGKASLGFLFGVAMIFGFVLAGTGSRAAVGYMAASFLAMAWLFRETGAWKNGAFWACLLLVAGGVGYVLVDGLIQPVLHDMGYIDREAAISAVERDYGAVGSRLAEWHKSWLMLLENPILGVGFGNYAVRSFWMGVEYPWAISEGTLTAHSHNFFFQVAAEFGLLGLAASLPLLFYVGKRLFIAKKTPEWWFVFSVCGAFAVNAMLEYALWDLHFAVFLIFFVVPFFSGKVGLRLGGFSARLVALAVFAAWFVVSWGVVDVYRKSMFYGAGVNDEFEMHDLVVTGEDSLWGREVNLLLMRHVAPSIASLVHQDKLTGDMVGWRPYDLVVFRRLQVAALKGDSFEVVSLSNAMVRMYPKSVNKVRDDLLLQDGIRGTESAELIKRYLVVK